MKPVPNPTSSWTSAGPEIQTDEEIESCSELPRQHTMGMSKPGHQDSSVSNLQIAGPEPSTSVDRLKVRVPAWKHLIDHPLSTDRRISLIMAIFSDRSEVSTVNHLCGDDAQTFVDVIDEVGASTFHLRRMISAIWTLLGRHWTCWCHNSRGIA